MPKPLHRALFLSNIDPALFEEQRERLDLIVHDLSKTAVGDSRAVKDLEALEGIRTFLDACSDKINPGGLTAAGWRAFEDSL